MVGRLKMAFILPPSISGKAFMAGSAGTEFRTAFLRALQKA